MSPRLLALIPLAVGINLAMGRLVSATGIPLFLDTVGTVLMAGLYGIPAALATGLLSQVAFTVLDGRVMWLFFLPVQLAVAAYAGFVAQRAMFASAPRAILAGGGLGVMAATLSWPIAYWVFGGVTATGVTLVAAALNAAGLPLALAVYGAGLVTDVADKVATFLLVWLVLTSLPARMAARFPLAARARGR